MRRSCAPSIKKTNSNITSNKPVKPTLAPCPQPASSSNQNNQNISNNNQVLYNILWSKPTTKKHKTWEGDGTLEIRDKICIAKDVAGNFLGSSNSIKPEQIFEGSQLTIGSKEIEIQDRIQDLRTFYMSRKLEKAGNEEPQEKKQRTDHSVFKPNLYISAVPKIRRRSVTKKSAEESVDSVLEADTTEKANIEEYDFKIASTISQHLRPHQTEGVRFLYECITGSRNPGFFGAILADEMGLGKTLQCLAICHALLKKGSSGSDRLLQRVLIVTPSSLTENWNNEVNKWLGSERMYAFVVDAKNTVKKYLKQVHIPFIITSYEMLVSKTDDFQNVGFDLIICDEGHRLKNSQNKTSICLQQLNIQRRILLTGTPIQNDLQEFFNLIDFTNPGILGSYQEYKYQYETPIVQSQTPGVEDEIKDLGERRAEELKAITSKFILRRTQSVNQKYLPKKTEFIVFVRPSELQQLLLTKVVELWNAERDSFMENMTPLQIITVLKKICNHPSLVSRASHDDLLLRYLSKFLPEWSEMGPFDSGKLELVQMYLEEIKRTKEKLVLVSNHTKTLDMLQGLCEHLEVKFSRLDGTTPSAERNSLVEKFNRENSNISVFLLSAKAGGVGLNLCGASSLILFDNDWNPSTDLQAMSRIWRDGQKSSVRIYRLITSGTIEEKIFQRQIAKTSLGSCVITDKSSISDEGAMKFSPDELKDLFSLDANFDVCNTHEVLKCGCLDVEEDPFQIKLDDISTQPDRSDIQMNELTKWKHHKPPIDDEFLKTAGLAAAAENIIFIFSNETELTS